MLASRSRIRGAGLTLRLPAQPALQKALQFYCCITMAMKFLGS
jgi:hypothetical protein